MLQATRRIVLAGAVAVIIAAAVLFSLARLLFPVVGSYRADIETFVSGIMGQTVRIGELDARWSGIYPSLSLGDVQLLDTHAAPVLVFKEVQIDIDWLALLREGRIEASAVTVVGSSLGIERDENGRINLVGLVQGASGETTGSAPHEWILTRRHLSFSDATVRWHDRSRKRGPLVFTGIQVELRNDNERHYFSASGALPAALGREAKVVFDIAGDPFAAASDWRASGFIEGDGLQLRAWSEQLNVGVWGVDGGVADISAWPEVRNGRLQRMDADIATYGLKFASVDEKTRARRNMLVDAASGRFAWLRTDQGWQLAVDRLVISRDKRAWLPVHAVLHYDERDGGQYMEGYSSFLQLEDLGDLALWWPETTQAVAQKLMEFRPRGQLQDVYFKRAKNAGAAPPRFMVRADALDVGWSAVNKIPGADGVDGSVVADDDAVFFAATGRDARLHFDKLFRNPLVLTTADGWIAATREESGWRVFSERLGLANSDIALDLEFAVDNLGGEQVPEIDLVGRFRNGQGAHKSLYLPAHIMPDALVQWLDRSIVDATVVDGGVVVRGPVNRFPFSDGDGRFEVRFQVEDGQLSFAPNWPRFDKIKADVAFNQESMSIVAQSGETAGNALRNVRVAIPDMIHHRAELSIDGHAEGTFADGLKYLLDSPLHTSVGALFAKAKAAGNVSTDLSLNVPLFGEIRHVGVDGAVHFAGNNLTLQDAAVDITHIDGDLAFTESSVSADKLRAAVWGQPATLNIRSENVSGRRDILIAAQGQTRLPVLREHLQLGVLNWFDGDTDWRGELRLPGAVRNGAAVDERTIKLAITSTLTGTRVKLPSPLGKASAAVSSLDVRMSLPFKPGQPLTVAYGENLRGIFELARVDQNNLQLQRGEIRLFDGAAALPERRGIRIAGKLPSFKQSEWQAFLFDDQPRNEMAADGKGEKAGAVVNQLDVTAQEATLLGRPFGKVGVRGESNANGWELHLTGDQLEGDVLVPAQSSLPMRLDFKRLELTSVTPSPGSAKQAKLAVDTGPRADPRHVPALQLRSQQFVYDQRNMGALALELEKIPGGVRLASSALDDGVTRLKASGTWTAESLDKQRSELDVQLQASNVGRALTMFGYAETIRDGSGEGSAQIVWPDAFDAFAPGLLSGSVNFTVEKGRVLDVEPGAGRIFGLFSVQALPRRLTLDFSDFFSKGFTFDKVEGRYILTDGVAHTDSFKLTGPAAQIDIEGDIDLGRRTYDQTVKVVPNLTGSLPMIAIGAGVVATPIAGAAALIAEKLLRKPVGKLTQANYLVTGPWDNPTVQNVSRKDNGNDASRDGAPPRAQ